MVRAWFHPGRPDVPPAPLCAHLRLLHQLRAVRRMLPVGDTAGALLACDPHGRQTSSSSRSSGSQPTPINFFLQTNDSSSFREKRGTGLNEPVKQQKSAMGMNETMKAEDAKKIIATAIDREVEAIYVLQEALPTR